MEFNVRYDRTSMPARIVKTVYDLNEANEYISKGHEVLFERIDLNSALYSDGFIFKNRNTGQCQFAESRKFVVQYGRTVHLSEDEWDIVIPVRHYARKRSLNIDWAAYVIPLNPEESEIFYVEDLIEDILVSKFWSSKIYAVDGIAKWNGDDLEFRRDLYDSSECMIVG
jgi:hypothetical protein